ncbi:MAG: DinB family protein [Ignavibacteriae bacterium]|nr:DinB family protein [Ignavibacteriota bacterium]
MKEGLIYELESQKNFFLKTVECLDENDSSFKPQEEMYTVAQHVGHTAETIDWFFDGVFGENGFNMNFENYAEYMKKYKSFDEAIQLLNDATARAIEKIKSLSEAELMEPITGEVMKGAPKMAVVGGITDHTAHHRGALAVYARLLNKVPQMPYGG